MSKNETPKQIKLTREQARQLQDRLHNKSLTERDIEILTGLLSFNVWLQERLACAKLSIKRLRRLFGFKNESCNKSKHEESELSENSSTTSTNENADDKAANDTSPQNSAPSSPKKPRWNPEKNHGRLSSRDYTGCPQISVEFTDPHLKKGKCPRCAQCNTKANITFMAPSVIVLLDSQPLVTGHRYELQKARCTTCQMYFTASLPEPLVTRTKYSPRCVTTIAIHHYYGGLPFKRLEMLQAAQNVPLPDATQYKLMNELHTNVVHPLVQCLRQCAAQGERFYFDDTAGRIVEKSQAGKQKTVHATALLSEYEGHRIYLFDTNTQTAGQQLKALVENRTTQKPFITMSDALNANFPTLDDELMASWIICLCLTHGRRRFIELFKQGDHTTLFILELIAQVYHHERHCRLHHLSDEQRLAYHQHHSAPIMQNLWIWFNSLLIYQNIEPNSPLGAAIIYMLKRWHWFTQFLRIPGAPLDNNICEQAIKVMIRYRNNSRLYRTCYGASIGDAMMSLLHSAVHAGVNIFDYITALQAHAESVQSSPEAWLPWNYLNTLSALNSERITASAVN